MQNIYKSKSSGIKRLISRRMAQNQSAEANLRFINVGKPSAESLIKLNKIANEHPFSIIYHTKVHDPL